MGGDCQSFSWNAEHTLFRLVSMYDIRLIAVLILETLAIFWYDEYSACSPIIAANWAP